MSTLTYRGSTYEPQSKYNELVLIQKKLKEQEKEIEILKKLARLN